MTYLLRVRGLTVEPASFLHLPTGQAGATGAAGRGTCPRPAAGRVVGGRRV